jgi:hypothetical protein
MRSDTTVTREHLRAGVVSPMLVARGLVKELSNPGLLNQSCIA